jgi:hypothetical protein
MTNPRRLRRNDLVRFDLREAAITEVAGSVAFLLDPNAGWLHVVDIRAVR